MSVYRHNDDSPVARLCAGGRHVRMAVMGRVPPGFALPDMADFERVVRLVGTRDGAAAAGEAVADPQRLPFVESLFDRALVTSALPPPAARAELREIWRVLAPAGLALLVVKARRPWQWQAPGWLREKLEPALTDAMFETLDWRIETLPDRYHLVLIGKRDGLRPAMIGRVAAGESVAATA